MVTSDFSPEVEIRPFRTCAMHPAIIIGTVRSLWMWLWGIYHVPQNAFLVLHNLCICSFNIYICVSCCFVYLTDCLMFEAAYKCYINDINHQYSFIKQMTKCIGIHIIKKGLRHA